MSPSQIDPLKNSTDDDPEKQTSLPLEELVSDLPTHASGSGRLAATDDTRSGYLPWLILLLASLGLFYFLQKGFNGSHSPDGSPATVGNDSMVYELPDGKKLKALPNSFTSLMVEYLQGEEPAGKCIALGQVFFENSSDHLSAKSDEQLSSLNQILDAFPGMNIVITGYAESSGSDDHNIQLSEDRAKAVMTWLIGHRVDPDRMQMKGMGDLTPASSKNPEDGDVMNRTIEVCVVKKK